jgi:hypothetical protein
LTVTNPAGEIVGVPADQFAVAKIRAPLAVAFQASILPLSGEGRYALTLTVNGKPDFVGFLTISRLITPPSPQATQN